MVSFLDELFSSHEKVIRKLIGEIREEYDVPGLDGIIKEIVNLRDLGYYGRLYDAVKLWWRIVDEDGTFTREEKQKMRFKVLASQNMRNFSLRPSLLDFEVFKTLYSFLEYFYYMSNNGKKLNHQDEMNVYFSGLDERIVFAQDKFDEIEKVPEPTVEFFQKLNDVKWQDKDTDKFFDKLEGVMFHTVHDIFGNGFLFGGQLSFYSIQSGFIRLLAGCSAVTNDREEMNKGDVIRAYKTYFKLMKTDTTKYKARPELNPESELKEYKGYLVCKKCNGYYKLEPGESPDGFDKCQCGGELEYMENIEDLK